MGNPTEPLVQRYVEQLLEVPKKTKAMRMPSRQQNAAQLRQNMLDVERQAQLARQAGSAARAQFSEFTQAHLHDLVAELLVLRLSHADVAAGQLFNLGDEFPAVLDALSARALTLTQLEAVIQPVAWLKDDIFRLVNQPAHRPPSGQMVKELKTALGLLGIETLQQLIPVYALRRCLPHATDPFTPFKHRLWEHSVAVALAARRLAQEQGANPFVCFCSALFQHLGYFAITRTYLRTYAEVKQQALLAARDDRDQELTDVIDALEADPGFLISCFEEFAPTLCADLLARWNLKRLPLAQVLDQIGAGTSFSRSHVNAQVVLQAWYFVGSRYLKQQQLLSDDEDLFWRSHVQLSEPAFHILQQTPLNKLNTL